MNEQKNYVSFPMDPRIALIHFSKNLTEYEKTEILNYETIYWMPSVESKQKKPKNSQINFEGDNNYGYDNEKNEYITEVGAHVAYRFEIQEICGKGSFGQVFLCKDHKNKEKVALKILRNKQRLYKQGLVEAKILF